MKTTQIYTQRISFSADSYTPVGLYLQLRDKHRFPCLLESNDYHSRANSKSFIGLDPLITVCIFKGEIVLEMNQNRFTYHYNEASKCLSNLNEIMSSFVFDETHEHNGFLSYFSFEYAQLVEGKLPEPNPYNLPIAQFILFEKLLVLDHFNDSGILYQNQLHQTFTANKLTELLQQTNLSPLPFELNQEEESSLTDSDFLNLVLKTKMHINRGNVFQLVVSRCFKQSFFGDDFEVYRTLRRLNPSPYLFYLDFEHMRLLGSSPETQITLTDGQAEIHPIAGTIKKSGNSRLDKQAILNLQNDEKENAEHTMLVDLARNDLSKFSNDVQVESYKEIQHFSHVIHMVSKVIAQTSEQPLTLFNATFPAGTLSGTPKPKALELIERLEPHPRGFYGGAVGFITSIGTMNLAILIRSALSKNNKLYYQAGAGIVLDSIPENEAEEVHNKLGAIREAIRLTQTVTL